MEASVNEFFFNQQNLIPVYLKCTSDPGFILGRFREMKASSDVNVLKEALRKTPLWFGDKNKLV